MGIDLSLGIQRHNRVMNWFLVYDRLSLDRDYRLFEVVRETEPMPIPNNIKVDWYDDEGVETITEDPYGRALTCLPADELVSAMGVNELSQKNTAVMRYLEALPADYMVVLYWH